VKVRSHHRQHASEVGFCAGFSAGRTRPLLEFTLIAAAGIGEFGNWVTDSKISTIQPIYSYEVTGAIIHITFERACLSHDSPSPERIERAASGEFVVEPIVGACHNRFGYPGNAVSSGLMDSSRAVATQHFLNFFPLPQGHGSFRPMPLNGFSRRWLRP